MQIRHIFPPSAALVLAIACVAGAFGQTNHTEKAMNNGTSYETATLAAGCFWCVEADFSKIPGVIDVVSGYAGGATDNPSYHEVSTGDTGHREAVQVRFDPEQTTYAEILDVFWRSHDPTDSGGSFGDRGFQYTSAIFAHDEAQRAEAEASKKRLDKSGRFKKPVATEILPFVNFFPAEEYHQNFSDKNPGRYKGYRRFSGRDGFIEEHWGGLPLIPPARRRAQEQYARPTDGELRDRLSPLAVRVIRENGTEPPFDNAYWDNHEPGIYVDAATGEPLFSSLDKFDSGSGWPSFTRPLDPEGVVRREDRSHFMERTEVRSRHGDSHLGHVFPDGPAPTGRRYCINSAALRFIPADRLEAEGYGEFAPLFKDLSPAP